MTPKHPIFVPTKGRYKKPYTINAFKKIGIPFTAVVEEQEYDHYAKSIGSDHLLVLPHKNKGLTVTRNWIWDYAQEQGYERYWTFDDNISDFYRLHNNIKWRMRTPTFLRVMEDFVERYENIAIAGMQYEMFVPRMTQVPPFLLNTRVYSNMLIKTDIPYRNETFYNDDTDLCLRVMKDGWCTVLFQAFLADKIATMIVKGGMTDYYEKTNKRLEFAEELQRKHPKLVRVVWKWGRWHHQVNYSFFKRNKLKRKPDVIIPKKSNNFGMKLITE